MGCGKVQFCDGKQKYKIVCMHNGIKVPLYDEVKWMQIPLWLSNSRPVMGVQSSLHVCGELGKGLWPWPLGHLVEGVAGAWEPIQPLDSQSESYECDFVMKSQTFQWVLGSTTILFRHSLQVPNKKRIKYHGVSVCCFRYTSGSPFQPWCLWALGS